MDAANMLKPALARGELRCIGATTLDEYRKHIEKDKALERRFQPVFVERAVASRTRSRSCAASRRSYEVHHGIRIRDAALVAAARAVASLHHRPRHCPTRRSTSSTRPRRASRWRSSRMPTPIDTLERRYRSSRSSAQALERRRTTGAAKKRLAERRARDRRAQGAGLGDEGAVAAREGADRAPSARRKEKLEQLKTEAERAQRTGDFDARRRAALRRRCPSSRRSSREAKQRSSRSCRRTAASSARRSPRRTSPRSSPSGPASPSRRCSRARCEQLLKMEDAPAPARGRPGRSAVDAVANAVRRCARRPAGSEPARSARFLFLGPTGVGKTELARALAEFLFDDEHAMVRIDMCEYMEKHTVVAPDRRASGLRRLRRGRPAHRGGAPPSVLGRPLRRDGEGAPRRVERAAPGARRRAAHRRPGPHGRLQNTVIIMTRTSAAAHPRRRRRRPARGRAARSMQELRAHVPARSS